jgi:hypothetical protein
VTFAAPTLAGRKTVPNIGGLGRTVVSGNSLAQDNGAMRISHGRGSVGEPPTPEKVEQWHRWVSPPENELQDEPAAFVEIKSHQRQGWPQRRAHASNRDRSLRYRAIDIASARNRSIGTSGW